MSDLALKLFQRTISGKKVESLRRRGIVPVHLYGRGIESQALQVEEPVLRSLLSQSGGNVPVTVEIEGQDATNLCFVSEIQRHPVSENILHVDFNRVDISRALQIEVPIILIGDPPAVRNEGGTLLQPLSSILVESLPMNIPVSFEIDVSHLDNFEKSVRVSDITVSSDVRLLRDTDEMVARVVPPRLEEEPVLAEDEEGDEVLETEEGDAPDRTEETPEEAK